VTSSILEPLAKSAGFPRISLYFPTHPTYPDSDQDPIRLAKALRTVERQLVDSGLRTSDISSLLASARERGKGHVFWRYQGQGLSVFIENGATHWIKLPTPVPEVNVVAERYHIRPLIPVLRDRGGFVVLAVTQNGARLFNGTRERLHEVGLEDLPSGVGDIRESTEFDANLGYHSRGRGNTAGRGGTPKYAALGESPEDYQDILLEHYARDVAKATDAHLASSTVLLIVAALPRMLGRLKRFLNYPHVAENSIDADPSAMREDDLQARAWAIAEPVLLSDRENVRARLRAALESQDSQLATNLDQILRLTEEGRIEVVFLSERDTVWGRYDESHRLVRIEPASGPDNEDLLNLVALKTLRQGGDVRTLPEELRSSIGPAAALLRY